MVNVPMGWATSWPWFSIMKPWLSGPKKGKRASYARASAAFSGQYSMLNDARSALTPRSVSSRSPVSRPSSR